MSGAAADWDVIGNVLEAARVIRRQLPGVHMNSARKAVRELSRQGLVTGSAVAGCHYGCPGLCTANCIRAGRCVWGAGI